MNRIILAAILFINSSLLAQDLELNLASDIWPPFTNVEGEKSIALDIVKQALEGSDIKVNYKIVEFDDVITGIKKFEYDGSAALWHSEKREELLLFSNAYLQNQLVLVGRKGSDISARSFSDIENIKIGLVENYAYGDEIANSNNIEIVSGKSDQQNLERLLAKKVDYILVDDLLIQYMLKYQVNDVSKFLEIGKRALIVKSLHFAIRKDIPNAEEIISQFNDEIAIMITDGSYHEILELNWIRADVDGDGKVELVLVGENAGEEAPENAYDIYYSDQNDSTSGYYINGTYYENWESVPSSYKNTLPKVEAPPNTGGYKFTF